MTWSIAAGAAFAVGTCVVILFGRPDSREGWEVPFRFFDHIAHVGLEPGAPTLSALFEEVALSLGGCALRVRAGRSTPAATRPCSSAVAA